MFRIIANILCAIRLRSLVGLFYFCAAALPLLAHSPQVALSSFLPGVGSESQTSSPPVTLIHSGTLIDESLPALGKMFCCGSKATGSPA